MRRTVKDDIDTAEQLYRDDYFDSIPDISNRPVSLETILNWIDLISEVSSNDEAVRNN